LYHLSEEISNDADHGGLLDKCRPFMLIFRSNNAIKRGALALSVLGEEVMAGRE
jgi:hypothetical protein